MNVNRQRMSWALVALLVLLACIALLTQDDSHKHKADVPVAPTRVMAAPTPRVRQQAAPADNEVVPPTLPSPVGLLVVDDSGHAIGGAVAWVIRDRSTVRVGPASRADGTLPLRSEDLRDAQSLAVVHPRLRPSVVTASDLAVATYPIKVVLSPAASAGGTVALIAGELPTGATLRAAPIGDSLGVAVPPRADADNLLRHPLVLEAAVSPSGSFRFEGLIPDVKYRLTPVVPGFAPAAEVPLLTPGAYNVELRLAPTYAVAISVVDADGKKIEMPEGVSYWPSTSLNLSGAKHPLVQAWSTPTILSASGDSELSEQVNHPFTPTSTVWMFTSTVDVDQIDGTLFFSGIPGYAPIKAEIPIFRLRGGPARVAQVVATKLADIRWGAVVFSIECDAASKLTETDSGHMLKLLPTGSPIGVDVVEVPLPASKAAVRIERVPAGTYRCGLRSQLNLAWQPSRDDFDLVVVADGETRCTIRLPAAGGLELGAAPGAKQATLDLAWTDNGGDVCTETIRFSEPPYRVSGLRRGRYKVIVRSPARVQPVEVIVADGQITPVDIVIGADR